MSTVPLSQLNVNNFRASLSSASPYSRELVSDLNPRSYSLDPRHGVGIIYIALLCLFNLYAYEIFLRADWLGWSMSPGFPRCGKRARGAFRSAGIRVWMKGTLSRITRRFDFPDAGWPRPVYIRARVCDCFSSVSRQGKWIGKCNALGNVLSKVIRTKL